jgi:integrase
MARCFRLVDSASYVGSMSAPNTPRELAALYFQFLQAQVVSGKTAEATVAYYRHQIDKWLKTLPAGIANDQLKPLHLITGSEKWHTVQAIQRLYNWAASLGHIGESPFKRTKRPALGQRERIMTRAELARLLRSMSKPHRLFFAFMRHTLARPGEIRKLKAEDYIAEKGALALDEFKAKKRRKDRLSKRYLSLDRFTRAMLERWINGTPWRSGLSDTSVHVFRNLAGRPYTKDGIVLSFRRAVKRAKLPPGAENLVPYTIRHTAATAATKNGIRDRTLAEIMGHTSTKITARYQHLDGAELGDAVEQATARPRRPRQAG